MFSKGFLHWPLRFGDGNIALLPGEDEVSGGWGNPSYTINNDFPIIFKILRYIEGQRGVSLKNWYALVPLSFLPENSYDAGGGISALVTNGFLFYLVQQPVS